MGDDQQPRAIASQKMVLELLLGRARTSYTLNSELDLWARRLSVGKPFASRHPARQDISHPAIAVNLDACIQVQPLRPRLP
jgi:formate dehydrogenase major subunit